MVRVIGQLMLNTDMQIRVVFAKFWFVVVILLMLLVCSVYSLNDDDHSKLDQNPEAPMRNSMREEEEEPQHYPKELDRIDRNFHPALAMNWTIRGEPFRRIKACHYHKYPNSIGNIPPETIHVIMIATPKVPNKLDMSRQKENVKEYCIMHGYHFSVVNPLPILKKYKGFAPEGGGSSVTASKSIYIKYLLRDTFHKFGCKVQVSRFI